MRENKVGKMENEFMIDKSSSKKTLSHVFLIPFNESEED